MVAEEALLEALAAATAPARVKGRVLDRVAFASDASFYRLVPRAVVQPRSIEEIRSLFAVSRAHRVPLVFRAAGTSLSGQAITDGILVDLAPHWGGVEVLEGGARVRVQPGVIGGRVNRLLAPYRRRIGPDPASIDACMMGGILANNASGMCCGVVENAYHTLARMQVVLPNGLVVDTGADDADVRLRSEAPELVATLEGLAARIQADPALLARIRSKYAQKNTTGYSLNALVDFTRPAEVLAHLLIGSEGTLGFIAQAELHTVAEHPHKLTGLFVLPSVAEAAAAVAPFTATAARAVELMDRACLRAVTGRPGMPPWLGELPEGAAALLVEWQGADAAALDEARGRADEVAAGLSLVAPVTLTTEAGARAALWKIRKGLFPSVGAARAPGTTVIIEDVAFPHAHLAEAVTALQGLFTKHGYPEGIVFGHAKDGNLHFVVTQSFNTEAEVARYAAFMDDVVAMVVDRFGGALKAEHGTGRNMAPFVAREWGEDAHRIMTELKQAVDPAGLLNPGVILNADPQAHLRDLKSLPRVEEEVDRCIECGFCEPLCPSRRLTTTPRQRIALRREQARATAPEWRAALSRDFGLAVVDSCATDGLCATACPVSIDTGALVKRLRAEQHPAWRRRIAVMVARRFAWVERSMTVGVWLGRAVARLLGMKPRPARPRARPTVSPLMALGALPVLPALGSRAGGAVGEAHAVYMPSCLGRAMARPDGAARGLQEALLRISARAGRPLWVPPDLRGHCCGLPFGSKGYAEAQAEALATTVQALWRWTGEGALPVVVDASSCTFSLRHAEDHLTGEDLARWRGLRILDAVEWLEGLLPALPLVPRPGEAFIHPTCAARKLGLVPALTRVAEASAETVVIPAEPSCCGTAGDRGLMLPELVQAALHDEGDELARHPEARCYSSNLTCEVGIGRATGRTFMGLVHLVDEALEASE
ncbi:MAG: FAD-binding oxidoreductase [Myxococcales bacterium]|nr:FAD-binding oxidoreductase [Myxococcales bacterium]